MGRPTLDELREKVKLTEQVGGLQEAMDAAWHAADEMMTVHGEWEDDESREKFEEWERRRDAIGAGLVTLYGEAPDRPRTALLSGEMASPDTEEDDHG